ncbi:hypothetical protein Emag_007703 [Eimeria magna]
MATLWLPSELQELPAELLHFNALGIAFMSMDTGTLIDNIVLSSDMQAAHDFARETFWERLRLVVEDVEVDDAATLGRIEAYDEFAAFQAQVLCQIAIVPNFNNWLGRALARVTGGLQIGPQHFITEMLQLKRSAFATALAAS